MLKASLQCRNRSVYLMKRERQALNKISISFAISVLMFSGSQFSQIKKWLALQTSTSPGRGHNTGTKSLRPLACHLAFECLIYSCTLPTSIVNQCLMGFFFAFGVGSGWFIKVDHLHAHKTLHLSRNLLGKLPVIIYSSLS